MADGRSPSLSVILPTYCERQNIEVLIPRIQTAFEGVPLEVLVVDDSSPDGTADAARELNARYQNVRVITRPVKEGIGAAIRQGLNEAAHEVLLTSDADNSFQTSDMVRLYRKVVEGADMVVGSRHSGGGRYDRTHLDVKIKFLVSSFGNRGLRLLTGLPIHDFSANFRAMRATLWRFLSIQERTNAILVEMILKTAYGGVTVEEIPITFAERLHGESKLNLAIEAPRVMGKLLKYVARYRFTGYHVPLDRAISVSDRGSRFGTEGEPL